MTAATATPNPGTDQKASQTFIREAFIFLVSHLVLMHQWDGHGAHASVPSVGLVFALSLRIAAISSAFMRALFDDKEVPRPVHL
jgi:hypothetical protein